MIRMGWARTNIRRQVGRVRAVFRWAEGEELIPRGVAQHLNTLRPLKMGRADLKESDPVEPVSDERVAATRPHLSRQVCALIDLQLLSSARPGELVALRSMDIDTTGEVWTATLRHHKNAHRGQSRTITFGPQAQAVLRKFMAGRAAEAYLFSPIEAEAERRIEQRERRKSKVQPSQVRRAEGGVEPASGEVEPSPDRSVVSVPASPVFPSITASSGPEKAGQPGQGLGLNVRGLLRHEDQRRYAALCEAGVLYEHLVARCGIRGMTRTRMKKRVMIDVLCGEDDDEPTPVSRAFEREFPNVMRVVRNAKRQDHARLARALQRLESGLMIDGVCGRLMRDRPDVPILSLHDAILTPAPYVEVVREAIVAEFARVGLDPTLKIELAAESGGEVRAAA
jgi:hypothetical protein